MSSFSGGAVSNGIAEKVADAPAQKSMQNREQQIRIVVDGRTFVQEPPTFEQEMYIMDAVVETQGSGSNAALQARWTYEDVQVVDESSRNISATGGDFTEFHISKPSGWPVGKYKVEILLNGQPVESEDFEVK